MVSAASCRDTSQTEGLELFFMLSVMQIFEFKVDYNFLSLEKIGKELIIISHYINIFIGSNCVLQYRRCGTEE